MEYAEASFCGASVIAADKNEPQGAEDNYSFICRGADHVRSVAGELIGLAGDDRLQNEFNDLAFETVRTNQHGLPEVIDGMEVEQLAGLASGRGLDFSKLSQRLYFYLVRRYQMQQQRGVRQAHSDARSFVTALCGSNMVPPEPGREDPVTYLEMSRLLAVYESARRAGGPPVVKPTPGHFRDHVFKAQRVGHVAHSPEPPRFLARDILKDDDYQTPDGSVDAVVTDPPYGYGESLPPEQIRQLYRALFAKSVRWLRHGGHLVFCALDKVRTGRTQDLVFTEEVLSILNKVLRENRAAIAQRHVFPIMHMPPFLYYWKSKYALNRAVIAVEIMKETT